MLHDRPNHAIPCGAAGLAELNAQDALPAESSLETSWNCRRQCYFVDMANILQMPNARGCAPTTPNICSANGSVGDALWAFPPPALPHSPVQWRRRYPNRRSLMLVLCSGLRAPGHRACHWCRRLVAIQKLGGAVRGIVGDLLPTLEGRAQRQESQASGVRRNAKTNFRGSATRGEH